MAIGIGAILVRFQSGGDGLLSAKGRARVKDLALAK
jgi:hypothetical protein